MLQLTNSGVGPAIITDVKVTYKDQVATDRWDLFEIQGIPDSIDTYITNSIFNDRIIKIGETLIILDLSDNIPLAQAFYERSNEVSISIYYESIYKEKWRHDGEKTVELATVTGMPETDQFR